MLFYMLITYIYFFNTCERLMIANTNLFTRDKLVDLVKKRRELKFIINCIYKFKIF